jgi:hypothetical protein
VYGGYKRAEVRLTRDGTQLGRWWAGLSLAWWLGLAGAALGQGERTFTLNNVEVRLEDVSAEDGCLFHVRCD